MLTLATEFKTDVTLGWWHMHRSEGFSNAMTAEQRLIWGMMNSCHFSHCFAVGEEENPPTRASLISAVGGANLARDSNFVPLPSDLTARCSYTYFLCL